MGYYSLENFINKIENDMEDFLCNINQGMLNNPIQFQCGHMFC